MSVDAAALHELVRATRTYRRYDGSVVSEDTLRELVDTARFAATGNNMQVMRFHLVAGGTSEADVVFSHLHWAGALKDWDGPVEGELPGGYVMLCLPEAAVTNAVRLIDVGIAGQTLALAASARGLGYCMHKSYDACLGDELGLTERGYAIAMAMSFGPRGELVVLEDAGSEAAAPHGLTYWREADGSHHVPKLSVSDLLI